MVTQAYTLLWGPITPPAARILGQGWISYFISFILAPPVARELACGARIFRQHFTSKSFKSPQGSPAARFHLDQIVTLKLM